MDEMSVESPARRTQKMKDVSGLLGAKLLEGWTMLGDTCAVCGTVLMKHGYEYLCVNCEVREQRIPPSDNRPTTKSNLREAQPKKRIKRPMFSNEFSTDCLSHAAIALGRKIEDAALILGETNDLQKCTEISNFILSSAKAIQELERIGKGCDNSS